MAQLMPLPLAASCFSKIQISFTFLVPATRVVPLKRLLKVCVCVCIMLVMYQSRYILKLNCITVKQPQLQYYNY